MTYANAPATPTTLTTEQESVYAVELEARGGAVTFFLFVDSDLGRASGYSLWFMLMREPGTQAVTRGPRVLTEIHAAFEQRDEVNVIDCR
jgi:hypothetical protein